MDIALDLKEALLTKAASGQRLSCDEGLYLYQNAELLELGNIANLLRKQKHPDNSPITFVIDRNINYTNVCVSECDFCAFHKTVDDSSGYVLDYETIKNKVIKLIEINGTQILLQGGLNPKISLDYYLNLLKNITTEFPNVSVHAFSPPEICFIAEKNNISIEGLLRMFKEVGLDSIPGGGAEILSDEVRAKLSPNKISSATWLEVMEVAHGLEIPTSATMMAGSIETEKDRIDHLIKIRELQDKSKGFVAFIPWSFQKNNTNIITDQVFTGFDYLKLVAISRIMLDNFNNIQVSWPTQGIQVSQVALFFGANDFGGVMMEENVLASTGLKIQSSVEKIVNAIKALNRRGAQRSTTYKILKEFA